MSWGLALLLIYYSNMYLKFKMTLGSFGESLATLTPGFGVKNLLLRVLQVSSYLDL